MNFELSVADIKRIEEWKRQFDHMPVGVTGGVFSYIFIPTTLGTIIKVRHVSGAELDLTDWDAF